MCVRTLIPTEVSKDQIIIPATSKYTKAKEKYMKLHDELVTKQMKIVTDNVEKIDDGATINTDILAKSTTIYAKCLESLSNQMEAYKNTKTYKILFMTTQPAHVIMIAAVLCVISAVMPSSERTSGHTKSRIMSFIYLGAFCMHFGAQIWMTFVSGLSLYFALPRHNFGEVQRVLFPKYFTINACLSLTSLLIFIKHHPLLTWDAEIITQIVGMATAFFLELLIRLYLTPPLLQLMMQKNMIERAAGVGKEIGSHNPGALKHCPHYVKIHGAFRKVHVAIAVGNMTTMACTVLHLYYIASKLCVL